jgi:hypothetical protein
MPAKLFTFMLLILAVAGCQSSVQPDGKPAGTKISGPHFQFSKAGMVQDSRDPGNWCSASFPEAVLLNPEQSNPLQRYFLMDDGVYKVSVELGNVLSAYILRKKGDLVEICTSSQYPQCLSKKENFALAADGLSFRYNNGKVINFSTALQPNGQFLKMTLEFTNDVQFGISVRKCAGCAQ